MEGARDSGVGNCGAERNIVGAPDTEWGTNVTDLKKREGRKGVRGLG